MDVAWLIGTLYVPTSGSVLPESAGETAIVRFARGAVFSKIAVIFPLP